MAWLRDKVYGLAARALTKPRGSYNLVLPNNLENLRRVVRKGDVILVDGEQRVSEVIKYLTQSSWSHVALYIGDELLRRHPERREELVLAALAGEHACGHGDHPVAEPSHRCLAPRV